VGPFKIFERNRFCFCFYKQNWVCKKLALSATPCFSDGPTVRTVRMRGSQTQSLCQFQICQRRRRRRRGVAGDFDPTHYFSFTFRHCGGVLRLWRAAALHACKKSPPCKTVPTETLSNAKRDRSPVRAMAQATTTIYIVHSLCF
jgi:hypothetical protein